MKYETALMLFEHTLDNTARVSTAINLGLLELVDQGMIESASLEVSTALATGARVWMTADLHLCYVPRKSRLIAPRNARLNSAI